MINHARSLLMNVACAGYGGFPGDEYIPPEYRVLNLPGYADSIRSYLFGADPDRVMLNYRTQQLLAMLHATELSQYVLDLDSRITYSPNSSELFNPSLYVPVVKPLNTANQDLFVIGEHGAPDNLGRMYHMWHIHVLSARAGETMGWADFTTDEWINMESEDWRDFLPGESTDEGIPKGTVEVIHRTVPVASSPIREYAVYSHISNPITLTGSGLQVKFREGGGAAWRVEVYARPQRQLGEIAAALRRIGEPTILSLFGIGSQRGSLEPFKTFYNLWNAHAELPYSLGGLVLALIYLSDLVRRGAL